MTSKHIIVIGAGISGLTAAFQLQQAGHEVSVFVMDAGARLLLNDELAGLCRLKGVSVTCCNLSLAQLGIEPSAIPPEVKRGSQYDNAGLMNAADHVISL